MELTRQVHRPQDEQQAHEGRNTIPQEEQQHLGAPRDVDGEGENSRTRGHDPYVPLEDGCKEGTPNRDDGGEELTPHQRRKEERS